MEHINKKDKVHFWPSNFCLGLVLSIELQNRVSSTTQLWKPFILNFKTGYLRPLNYENRSFFTIGLFWWPVSLTWTPHGCGTYLSVIISPLSLSFPPPSFFSPLSGEVPGRRGGRGGSQAAAPAAAPPTLAPATATPSFPPLPRRPPHAFVAAPALSLARPCLATLVRVRPAALTRHASTRGPWRSAHARDATPRWLGAAADGGRRPGG